MRTTPTRARAFTIVEAAISIVIVGVLLVASTATFGTIARSRQQQTESRAAFLLGQQLMAEIMQKYFSRPGTLPSFGPLAGQTRATFDCVDAYHGYVASPPASASGAALVGYANWSQRVSVTFVDPANPASAVASSSLKKVTVTVTSPSGKSYALTGLRSRFGAYELSPTALTTYVTGVAISAKAAAAPKPVYGGAHPLNVTTTQ